MVDHKSQPTAYDVARLAGVSQAAVSRAFTPGASIANSTREKVFDAAHALGYRPNLLARSLSQGKSGIIGVIIGSPLYPFFVKALDLLSSRLADLDKHILIYTTNESSDADEKIEGLLNYRVESIVLMSANVSKYATYKCQKENINIISLTARSEIMDGFVSITGENFKGGGEIAEHLLAMGYRRLAVMAGVVQTSTSQEREDGFTNHLLEQGVPPVHRAIGNFQREGAIEAARDLLSRPVRPDAIFCANDDMAIATIEVARFEFGLDIGRELGVAGFDDIDQASWPSFSLTTYSLPIERLVDQTVAQITRQNNSDDCKKIVIDGGLIGRNSTRR